ncbi:MAG: phosphatase PAP2 family protein [Cyclobacterium sp.]|uniref:phosphatase PAP2 family protein n=1 Tax=Cyclobacterium sp. TaxID=1966343 RepID=UPI0039709A67
MKEDKTKGEAYLKGYFLFLIFVCAFFPFYEKGGFEVLINTVHNPLLDQFFVCITQLGDGVMLIFPILIMLFIRYSYAIFLALSTIIHILFVHLGKRVFFPGMPRPVEFLSGIELHIVPGVSMHHWNTFPSGHTTSIFMLTCAVAILSPKQKALQLLVLVIAILTGFSRIYLMQHFLIDVVVGSFLGVVAAYSGRWMTIRFFSKKKFRKSLLSNRKRKMARPIME